MAKHSNSSATVGRRPPCALPMVKVVDNRPKGVLKVQRQLVESVDHSEPSMGSLCGRQLPVVTKRSAAKAKWPASGESWQMASQSMEPLSERASPSGMAWDGLSLIILFYHHSHKTSTVHGEAARLGLITRSLQSKGAKPAAAKTRWVGSKRDGCWP